MSENLTIQGRGLNPGDLHAIRQWLEQNPGWSRWRLSQHLATHWDWRNGAGQLKDMAARTLLMKLEQRGLIRLPPRRQIPTNRMRCGSPGTDRGEILPAPIRGALAELTGLQVREVSRQKAERSWVRTALGQFHYLGFSGAVGENLQYVVDDNQGRRLACLVLGAAAWKCQDRDRFIGWSAGQRERNLSLLANNTRFLILPGVQVPGLGSWILGQIARRIGEDWPAKYGREIVLLETFVERPRFAGTVYRAANWQHVGVTTGRTRQDRHTCIQVAVKDLYVYPLRRGFREVLRG